MREYGRMTDVSRGTATTGQNTGSFTATSSAEASSGEGGLNDAAKMGLGIGIGIGVAALISAAILVWYWMRNRRVKAVPPPGPRHHELDSGGGRLELPEGVMLMKGSPKELGGDQAIYEMHTAENGPTEMHSVGNMWKNQHGPELHACGENAPAEMSVGSPRSYFSRWR